VYPELWHFLHEINYLQATARLQSYITIQYVQYNHHHTGTTNPNMCIAFVKNAAPTLPPDDGSNRNHPPKFLRSSTHSLSSSSTETSVSPTLGVRPTKASKERVRLINEPEVISIVKPSSSMTDEERCQTHWQLHDYEYFRGTARIIASEVLKLSSTGPPSPHSYDTVLTRAHQLCSYHLAETDSEHVSTSIDSAEQEMKSLGEEICLPPNLFAALTHWARAGHSRRGLEKFCVPHHMQTRPLERQAVVQAVLIAQDLLRDTRRESPKDGKFRVGTWEFSLALPDDEILRMISERFTKTSKKFATAMGHADAAAIGNYDHGAQI